MKNTKKESNAEEMLEILQSSEILMEHIWKNYKFDERRFLLLQDIFRQMENKRQDELVRQIYLYGSMVKEQDLVARQLFLWMAAMADDGTLAKTNGIER